MSLSIPPVDCWIFDDEFFYTREGIHDVKEFKKPGDCKIGQI